MKYVELTHRIPSGGSHYDGGLVAGADSLKLFGDAATALAWHHFGHEGLLSGLSQVQFIAPVSAGDFVRARVEVTRVTRLRVFLEASIYTWKTRSKAEFEKYDDWVLAATVTGVVVDRKV